VDRGILTEAAVQAEFKHGLTRRRESSQTGIISAVVSRTVIERVATPQILVAESQ
jgi:hypothetical protein